MLKQHNLLVKKLLEMFAVITNFKAKITGKAHNIIAHVQPLVLS